MMSSYPIPTSIYHITHIDNLPAIIDTGCLYSDNRLAFYSGNYIRIGYSHIKLRRQQMIGSYVPFYYAPRSPMLYVIANGGVDGYQGGQEPIIYLVSTVQMVVNSGTSFLISDGNAATIETRLYDTIDGLNYVDWSVMDSEYWNNTAQFPDRKRRRQAEFLVQGSFPIKSLTEIGTYSEEVALRVRKQFEHTAYSPVISAHRNWYY